MDTSKLEEIGLTRNQALVYTALLKLGSVTVKEVIKESGLHSSRVYESLERLQKLGLTGFVVKDYKKYFQAAHPRKLFEYLDEKKEIILQVLPELEQLEGMKKEEINASVYKGKEGLKTIHSEMLKENKDIYLIGAKGVIFDELPYFMPGFEKQRIKKKLKFIGLWDKKEVRDRIIKKPFFQGKTFPMGFESNAVVNIFGGKVAIVLWKERYPTGFLIENKDVAEAFRKWFRFMYQNI